MVSRIFATEQAEDLASLEKVLELLQLKILSYPEEQRDRYSEFIVRWLNNHLLASDINIQLSKVNLTEEKTMSLKESIRKLRNEGRQEGIREGIAKGIEEGIKLSIINLSRNLNLTVEQIAEALRLPIERVERTLAESN